MPTYEYECGACGHKFEKFQSITAEPIKVCPQCSKKKVKRLIGTGAGLIFKGSGFYITDYRSDSYKNSAKSDSSSSSPTKTSETSTSTGSSSSSAKAPAPAAPSAAKPSPSKAKE